MLLSPGEYSSERCCIRIICYFSSLSHQPSGLRLLQRNTFATFIRSITRRCAHATAPAHYPLLTMADGRLINLRPRSRYARNEHRRRSGPCIYGCKCFLLSMHAVGHFLPFACPVIPLGRERILSRRGTIMRLAV